MRGATQQQSGFTLFELIMMIVLLGILAVSATALFPRSNPYASMAARDQLISAARFAQQTAMNRGPDVNVTLVLSATSYQVVVDGSAIELPGGGTTAELPNGTSVSPGTVAYNSLGSVSVGAGSYTISVSGEADRSLTIEGSGYAH